MKLRNFQWQLASSICLVLIPACSVNFIHSAHDRTPAASASELFPRRTQTELKGSRLVTFQEATEPSQHSPRRDSMFTGVAYTQVDARLRKLIERLDTKTLVGQTLMVGYDCYECGETIEETVEAINKGLKDLVREYKIGGVILFKRNFPPQFSLSDDTVSRYVANLTESLQNTAADRHYFDEGDRLPLLIGIDQEGGGGVRLTTGVTRTPWAMHIGSTRSEPMAYTAGGIIGKEMRALGINTVLAPLADVNNNNENDVIGKRAFGAHKDLVAPLSDAFMIGLRKEGVLSVAKHFPGHGTSKDDPHFVLPMLGYADQAELEQNDLIPFRRLIVGGVDGIMTAHIMAGVIDRDNPITFSEIAIHGLLRQTLQFKGLVFADDLTEMMGILMDETGRIVRDRKDVALKAYEAGTDILILARITNRPDQPYPERTVTTKQFAKIHAAILEHFKDQNHRRQLEDSVVRILRAKVRIVGQWKDLHDPEAWVPDFNPRNYKQMLAQNRVAAEQIAEASAVLLSEEGRLINALTDSTYFGKDRGPLTSGFLLMKGDTVTIASPVFIPPDDMSDAISSDWIPRDRVHTVHMVYGWRNRETLKRATELWGEPVERLWRRDSNGNRILDSQAIERKAEQIINAARGSCVLVFGVMQHAHIEVLKRVTESLEEQDKTKIIVLVFLEPYFIPTSLYERRNTIFLSVAALPSMQTVRKVLFGRLTPQPIAHLSVSIPGLRLDRSRAFGAPLQPLGQVDESYWQRFVSGLITGFWQDLLSTLLGSLSGGFLLFIVPRGTLRWTIRPRHQYVLVELVCSLGFSVLIGLFVFLFFPFLEVIDIGPFKLTNLGSVPRFLVALAAAFILGAAWLKMIARRGA